MLAESRPALAALIAIVLFFAGGAVGSGLASALAPASGVTAMVSFLALPAAFMFSLVLWQGLTAVTLLFRLLVRGRRDPARGTSEALRQLARKAWLLVPMPLLFACAAGLVAGVLGEAGFFRVVAVYTTVGLVYGLVSYVLARRGMLPLLED